MHVLLYVHSTGVKGFCLAYGLRFRKGRKGLCRRALLAVILYEPSNLTPEVGFVPFSFKGEGLGMR